MSPRTILQLRTMILRGSIGLGAFILFARAQPALAAPAKTREERPVETVRFIIVDEGIEEDWLDHFREQTRDKVHLVITDAGFVITDDVTADATVRLSLKVDDAADFIYHYEIEITVGDQHTALDDAKCEDCLTDKLVLVAEQQAPRIVDALKVARVRPTSTNAAEADGPTDTQQEQVRPLGPLGGAGIGVAVLGLAATIAGAVELSKGKVFDPAPLDQPAREFVDHRPAGGALLGVGLAAVTAGVALLVTDVVIRGKQRRNQQSGAHTFFPLVGPGVAGVGLIRNF